MLLHQKIKTILLGAGLILLLAACGSTSAPAPTQPAEPTQTLPTIAPTAVPNKSLVVCVGAEPDSLYMYANSSRTTWSILEAVYDGPFDQVNYQPQPVILQSVPSVAGGDVAVKPVEVKLGDAVIDANGTLTALAAGLEVYPAGCNSSECLVKWDGSSALQMDQLTATFKFKNGLLWSDGQPLKASDSVYSFRVASDAATPVNKKIIDRTTDYRAVDDTTLTWTGVPGYWPQSFDTVFFLPLPEHALGGLKPADLLTADAAVKSPLGWGPYMIDEWVAGDHITLSKNLNYFRASEGLPKFDHLVYRFISEQGDANLVALLTGECDVIDSSTLLDDQLETIVELSNSKQLNAYFAQGPEWEHLDFSVTPEALDGGAVSTERPDYFGDTRTRQAVASCVDTDSLYESVMHNRSAVPAAYYPPNHPYFNADLKAVTFDTDAGAALLEEIGWKDEDGDPATPRVARGVANIPDGTPFSVTLLTTQAAARQQVAGIIAASLGKCGVQVTVKTMTPDELYAAGPEGPLFGRDFDLALFAWQSSNVSPCFLYTTSQIPNSGNNYIGANITGYSDTEYDALCKAAQQPGLSLEARKQAEAAVQAKFNADLPVVPLFYHLETAVTRTDLCGLMLDSSARSALRDLEQFDIDGCPAK